jgi:hypothetical protein
VLQDDANHLEKPLPKKEISAEFKKAIEAEGDFTRLALDPRVPDRTACIGVEEASKSKRSCCSS